MADRSDSLVRWPSYVLLAITIATATFLFAPLVIVIIQSFTDATYLAFPPPSFGTRWYEDVVTADEWRDAFRTSIAVAVLVTPLSLVIGTMAALGLDRGPLRGRRTLFAILVAPMILPHIVLGLALFRVALYLQATDSIAAYTIAHLTITVPYVVITVGASLQNFEISLEEAARSLGASPVRALLHVTLPIIRPGLIGGAIFSFIISFDEFIITFFLSTFELTLPIQIFSTLMFQVEPSIAAVSTLMLAFTALLTLLLMWRGQIVSKDGSIIG